MLFRSTEGRLNERGLLELQFCDESLYKSQHISFISSCASSLCVSFLIKGSSETADLADPEDLKPVTRRRRQVSTMLFHHIAFSIAVENFHRFKDLPLKLAFHYGTYNDRNDHGLGLGWGSG